MDLKRIARFLGDEPRMAISARLSKSVRDAKMSCKDSVGLIEFLGMYDLEDGTSSFRFLTVVPGDANPELLVFDAYGKRMQADARVISKDGLSSSAKAPKATSFVLSVVLPTDTTGFFVAAKGAGFLQVTPVQHLQTLRRRSSKMRNPGIDKRYQTWIAKNEEHKGADNVENLPLQPCMSVIVPLYNTPISFFNDMVESVKGQSYQNWELILVNASPDNADLRKAIELQNDVRIEVVELEDNRGISENTLAGINVSRGDYIVFLDHDDVLEPKAFLEYVKAINAHPDADLLYCDEDSVAKNGDERFNPRFKPEFNLDLLLSYNYACHMLAVSRRAWNLIEHYDSSFDGAQDYDLTLKVSRVARSVIHVPKILYHWRQHEGSTNGGSTEVKPYVVDSSIKTLSSYMKEDDIDASVEPTDIPCVFRIVYPKVKARDVSLIIAYESVLDLMELLLSIDGQRKEAVREIVTVGPALEAPIDKKALEEAVGVSIRPVEWRDSYDFPAMINKGAQIADGDYLLIVKHTVRFDSKIDSIGLLRDLFCRENVGIASAKVMTMDNLILHAGLCVKENGSIGYLNQGFIHGMGGGYHGCAEATCDYSAVDSMCAMVRAADFAAAGGFSEDYDDDLAASVDLSFKVRSLGKLVMVTPYARVNAYMTPSQMELGKDWVPVRSSDYELLWSKWGAGYKIDVLANPNVDLSASFFRLSI